MTLPMLTCPLCCRPGFNSAFALWSALAESSTRQLSCPICDLIVEGLNDFAVHLFSHRLNNNNNKNNDETTGCHQTRHVEPHLKPAPVETTVTNGDEPRFESCRELLANGDFAVPSESTVVPSNDEQSSVTGSSCEICGCSFPNATILGVHFQILHKDQRAGAGCGKASPAVGGGGKSRRRVLSCEYCPRTFSLKSSLKVHMRVSHPSTQADSPGSPKKDGDRFACPTCGKSFNKETSLAQHVKTHEEKPWQCNVCSKNFSTKYFLRKHKRIHTGETPYECPTCHKVFTFQQSYHKHMLYHTDDKPYCCSSCGRLFKELSTLTNHERIHTGEKPFVCETCGKAFRQRVSYLVHRRIHTGDMPYKCTACNKSFRYKISQKTHKCPEHPPGIVVRSTNEKPKMDASVPTLKDRGQSPKDASSTFDINQFLDDWASLELNAGSPSNTPSEQLGRLSICSSTSARDDDIINETDQLESGGSVRVRQLSFEDAIREDAICELFSVAD